MSNPKTLLDIVLIEDGLSLSPAAIESRAFEIAKQKSFEQGWTDFEIKSDASTKGPDFTTYSFQIWGIANEEAAPNLGDGAKDEAELRKLASAPPEVTP